MLPAGIIAFILAVYVTAVVFKSVALWKRVCWFCVGIVLFFVSCAGVVTLISLLSPDLARQYSSVAAWQAFLIRATLLTNFLGAMFFGLAVFFIVAAITVLSSKLKR